MDRPDLIEEAMEAAKLMGGASWPSADTTRWALERLAQSMTKHLEARHSTSLKIQVLMGAQNSGLRKILTRIRKGYGGLLDDPTNQLLKDVATMSVTPAEKVADTMEDVLGHAQKFMDGDEDGGPLAEAFERLDTARADAGMPERHVT